MLMLIICTSIVLGSVLYVTSLQKFKKTESDIVTEKLNLVADDFKAQFSSMFTTSHKLTNDKQINKSINTKTVYDEVLAYEQLSKYLSMNILPDNLFMYVKNQNMIMSAGFGKSELNIFAGHYGVYLSNKEFADQLDSISIISVLKIGTSEIMVFPTFVRGRDVLFGYVLTDKKITDRIQLLIGEINGNISVYYRDTCIYGKRTLVFDDKNNYRIAEPDSDLFISNSPGNFIATFEQTDSTAFISINDFALMLLAFGIVILLVFSVLAIIGANRNYKPIDDLISSYTTYRKDDSEKDEITFIKMLLDSFIENEKQSKEHMQRQYRLLQKQMRQLISVGDVKYCELANEGFLDIHLSGPFFCVCIYKGQVDTDELEMLTSELSDENIEYSMSVIKNGELIATIISTDDEDNIASAIVSLNELYAEHQLTNIGISDCYRNLTETGSIIDSLLKHNNQELKTANEDEQHNKHASEVISMIDMHITDPELSLTFLEDRLSLSSRYISSIVKEETGFGYKDYIIHRRMEIAAKLLHEAGITVTDACRRSGYYHLSHFIKTFRQYYGVTPSAYQDSFARENKDNE